MTYIIKLILGLVHLLPETRGYRFKARLLACLGFDIDPSAVITSSLQIVGKPALSIGSRTYLGHYLRIYGDAEVALGANIDIGPEVSLVTGTHTIDLTGPRAAGEGRCDPIKIGDGCWICTRSVVLGGTKIGRHCVVAAGSVVRGEFEDYSLIGGSPARKIRDLREHEPG